MSFSVKVPFDTNGIPHPDIPAHVLVTYIFPKNRYDIYQKMVYVFETNVDSGYISINFDKQDHIYRLSSSVSCLYSSNEHISDVIVAIHKGLVTVIYMESLISVLGHLSPYANGDLFEDVMYMDSTYPIPEFMISNDDRS